MPYTTPGKRSRQRGLRQKWDVFWSRIPGRARIAAPFTVVFAFGSSIACLGAEEDVLMGGTVAAIGLIGPVWQTIGYFRDRAIARQRERRKRRNRPPE